jgi:hypothetical protein
MSGFEIVELVLTKFPLVVSQAEDYLKAFKPLKRWNQFRTEFIDFIDAVDV